MQVICSPTDLKSREAVPLFKYTIINANDEYLPNIMIKNIHQALRSTQNSAAGDD